MSISPITTDEFEHFRRLIYDHAGIALSPEKKVMVASRLAKRLDYYGLSRYGEYFQLINNPDYPDEFQILVNILTTNETYFFREPKHFDFFREQILKPWRGDHFRVWSAASSTGEEAYSLAMVAAENLGMRAWEVFASDLSTRVLDIARNGVYLLDRLEHMEPRLLEKYCLKGVRAHEGFFRIDAKIRNRVKFDQVNLKSPLPPNLGKFEVIFLRNVLIYFDQDTKKQVVERLATALKPDGYFFISHSESLHRVTDQLQIIEPSIYRKA
ncbi:protein-glutamate O-methyltransferase CheR [Methylomonas sp. LL1]|uniref:CheR family methyltransferase n=1 Tax=Methylomonas sp. LL1 TaxID=2785785 RepID=UPI0018C360C2|nr:protein-glutamate O-methyltransferase CheR [Methylomonas sp. LL1]QPK63904.1 protein-glutamate O-methyltransferase CheR [Methylomonas sp. LL1]